MEMNCDTSCSCDGQLSASTCALFPGCSKCTSVFLIVVRFEPIDLMPDESIRDRVARDDMLSQLPPQYRQDRMN